MKLIAGLGNPGKQYQNNRHNIGFILLDFLYKGFVMNKKFDAEVLTQGDIIFVKPMTFMNKSGNSISKIANFYKIEPKDILVIHDEIDFDTGKIQLKFGGSSAGHNGLKSMIAMLGTHDFYRLRVGVSRPATKEQVVSYVLSDFTAQEKNIIMNDKIDEIKSRIDEFISV